MMATGSSDRGLSEVSTTRSDHREATGPHLGPFALVTVASAPEQADHPTGSGQLAGRGEGRLQPGRGVGVVDQHRERGARARPPPSARAPARQRPGPRPPGPASTPSEAATVAATRALSTLNIPDSGTVTGRPRHRNDDEPTESTMSVASDRRTGTTSVAAARLGQAAAPGVVDVDHRRPGPRPDRTGGPWPRSTPPWCRWWSRWSRLRLVKAATSKTMPSTRCWARPWEDTSMATARRPASRKSASRAWSTGASGVVRSPSRVPMHAGRASRWLEDRAHQMGDRGLPVGPGDPDHGHGPGGMAVEGGGHPGHGRPHRARRHPHLGHVEVEEPLAQEPRRPAATASAAWRWPSVLDRRARSRTATPAYPPAVELDTPAPRWTPGRRAHRPRRCRGSDRSSARGVFRRLRMRRTGGWRPRPGPPTGPSVVAPAGTEMVPVPPMAELDDDAVAAAVVGIP